MSKGALTFSAMILALLASLLSCNLSACAQIKSRENQRVLLAEQPAQPALPKEPVGIKEGDILLAYPRGEKNNKIDSVSTFLIGSVPPGKNLRCNGISVRLNGDGFFAHVVKLNYGQNQFKLALEGQEKELSVIVLRPAPAPVLSASSFKILPESLEPHESLGVSSGDIIQFAARATPGCNMAVFVGKQKINMRAVIGSDKKQGPVNLGLDTAFGIRFQRHLPRNRDLYLAYYKVQPQDNWENAAIVFRLEKGKKQLGVKAKGSLTVVKQPKILQTKHKNTIVRLGPGQARCTPLPEGVRFLEDGYKGEWSRLELCSGKHVWIAREDLSPADDMSVIPQSTVSTVNLASDNYGARIAVPLNQKLPYQLEQDLAGNKIVLRIFGATADTDFVTSDLRPEPESAAAKLVEYLSWKQKSDLHYELSVHMPAKQHWGYYADYEDNTLVLHIKSAPAIELSSGNLQGALICIDPGHGGHESGSIGCSGIREARLNLALAEAVQKELQSMGARVLMTRTADTDLSLQERVDKAIDARADLLVSIHNNALPDGRDPWTEHGTSSYWYHPQSIELAKLAQKDLSKETGFKDYGCRYQNLALCRPTHMPALLMEVGFMINPDELSRLLDPAFQEKAGKSIAHSIRKFLLEKCAL